MLEGATFPTARILRLKEKKNVLEIYKSKLNLDCNLRNIDYLIKDLKIEKD